MSHDARLAKICAKTHPPLLLGVLKGELLVAWEELEVTKRRYLDAGKGTPQSAAGACKLDTPKPEEARIVAEKYAAMELTKWPHGPEPTDLIAHRNVAICLARAFLQKEADRQYHMNAINRLAAEIGALGLHSDAVIQAALVAIRGPQSATTSITPARQGAAWMVERGQPENQYPTIWWRGCKPRSGEPYLGQWTEQAIHATRFASKESAEEMARYLNCPEPYRVTEHVFMDATNNPPDSETTNP